ncbi:hypothetical protein FRC02_004326 [Tulasnella sp. 418]|nr:hypothetical protein FRC02_004326 [Tulasnella sp. 418]
MENESAVIPAQDDNATLKVGRKRERETSIEPQTPKGESDDPSTVVETRKRPAAKKNRLESLDEEDSSSPPRSPPLDHPIRADSTLDPDSATTAHPDIEDPPLSQNGPDAPKLREIQKQVKDLSWQDPSASGATPPEEPPTNDHHMRESTASPDKMDTEKAHDIQEIQEKASPVAAMIPLPEEPEKNEEIVVDASAETSEKKQDPVTVPEPSPSQELKPLASPIDITNDQPVATLDIPAPSSRTTPPRRRRSTDSDPPSDTDLTKSPTGGSSRKRKLITRESGFANDTSAHNEETSKRSRDSRQSTLHDEAGDETEGRAPKRVATPPPSGPASPPTSPPKRNGFGSFASAVSPLANVSGNTFGSVASQPKPFVAGFGAYMSSSSPFAKVASTAPAVFGQQSQIQKTSSFTDTTSPTSHQPLSASPSRSSTSINPFVPTSPPARSRSRSPSASSLNKRKSPPPPQVVMGTRAKPGQAFGSYNNARVGFASANASRHSPSPSLDATKANGGESQATEAGTQPNEETKNASWGEMLGSQGNGDVSDDEGKANKKLKVEEVEVTTGEENENTKYQVRAKLFQLDTRGTFKERGTGVLKINVRKSDESGARIVMRADGVYRTILNVLLFPGMHFSVGQDPRYLKLASIENGVPTHYAIRVSNAKVAQELYDNVESYIPSAQQAAGEDDDESDGEV